MQGVLGHMTEMVTLPIYIVKKTFKILFSGLIGRGGGGGGGGGGGEKAKPWPFLKLL